MVTKTKQSKTPTNTNNFGNVRIAAPIYVGVTSELAKAILEALRKKVGAENVATPSNTSIKVVDNLTTQSQHELENRLRLISRRSDWCCLIAGIMA